MSTVTTTQHYLTPPQYTPYTAPNGGGREWQLLYVADVLPDMRHMSNKCASVGVVLVLSGVQPAEP